MHALCAAHAPLIGLPQHVTNTLSSPPGHTAQLRAAGSRQITQHAEAGQTSPSGGHTLGTFARSTVRSRPVDHLFMSLAAATVCSFCVVLHGIGSPAHVGYVAGRPLRQDACLTCRAWCASTPMRGTSSTPASMPPVCVPCLCGPNSRRRLRLWLLTGAAFQHTWLGLVIAPPGA